MAIFIIVSNSLAHQENKLYFVSLGPNFVATQEPNIFSPLKPLNNFSIGISLQLKRILTKNIIAGIKFSITDISSKRTDNISQPPKIYVNEIIRYTLLLNIIFLAKTTDISDQ